MDLSIITVTWNSSQYIQKQIHSTKKACSNLDYEQIIVDNSSDDDTVVKVQNEAARLIKNTENKGFGYANNQGVKIATGKYILFLNPDMEFTQETEMKEMIKYMESNPDVGIMSCKLVDRDGKISQLDMD